MVLKIKSGAVTERKREYLEYLKTNINTKSYLKQIIRRIENHEPGAFFETTVFCILKWFGGFVEPCATGPDFKCVFTGSPVYCEAKFIMPDTVQERTKLPETPSKGCYGLLTETIQSSIKGAAKQPDYGKETTEMFSVQNPCLALPALPLPDICASISVLNIVI